jgi:hypothetical protein
MEDPMLGGQWKIPGLVAIGMFHAWWPLECSMLGGHWNVKEKKNTLSPFPFSPNNLYLCPQFFPLDPTVLLYHGLKPLLTPFYPLLRSKNYDYAPPCNKSFTPSLST